MYQHKKKSPTAKAAPLPAAKKPQLTPEQQVIQRQRTENLSIQRQKQAWMGGFKQTVTPQKEALSPVLTAGKFRTEHEQAIQGEKQTAQTELNTAQAALPASEVIQRLQALSETQSVPRVQRTPDGRLFIPTMQAATQHFNEQLAIQRKKSYSGSIPMSAWQQTARQTTSALVGLYHNSHSPVAQRQQELASSLASIENTHDRSMLSKVVLSQVKPAAEGPVIQRMLDERIQEQSQQQNVLSNLATVQRLQAQLSDLEQEASIQNGPALTKRIEARRGQGFTLPVSVQRQLEQGLNTDLSGVRIHADQEADKLSKSVGAVAFTTGTDIFFQSNKYDPHSTEGFKLLAHETTHVKQQIEGRAAPGIDSNAGLETEAKQAETKLSNLKPASKKSPKHSALKPAAQTGRITGALQRQAMTANQALEVCDARGKDISKLSREQKLMEAIKQAPMKAAIRHQLLGLINPTSLGIAAGAIAVAVGAQFTPIGWVADVVAAGFLAWGVISMGTVIIDAAVHLKEYFVLAANAKFELDLKRAGNHFADAVASIGVNTAVALISHYGAKRINTQLRRKAVTELQASQTASKAAGITASLEAKYGKPVIAALQKKFNGNTVQLTRALNYFDNAPQLERVLLKAGSVETLLKLINGAQTQKLTPTQLGSALITLAPVLPKFLKRSEREIAAGLKLAELERNDMGHSLASHGPDLTDAQLKSRIISGIAPDRRPSATHTSTRFNSYDTMLKAREYAKVEAARTQGIDLSKPPNQQTITLPSADASGKIMMGFVQIDVSSVVGSQSIGSGFTVPTAPVNLRPVRSAQNPHGTGTRITITSNGVTRVDRTYPPSSIVPIRSTINKVQIALTWDGNQWVVGQFFSLP